MIVGTQGYIACSHFEESIRHFGEADTPEGALSDFIESKAFSEYCEWKDIENGTLVVVKVFRAIYTDSPGANPEDWEDGWEWILGEEVSTHKIPFLSESQK